MILWKTAKGTLEHWQSSGRMELWSFFVWVFFNVMLKIFLEFLFFFNKLNEFFCQLKEDNVLYYTLFCFLLFFTSLIPNRLNSLTIICILQVHAILKIVWNALLKENVLGMYFLKKLSIKPYLNHFSVLVL